MTKYKVKHLGTKSVGHFCRLHQLAIIGGIGIVKNTVSMGSQLNISLH